MKKVFIKYNPYKIETEILVNGEMLERDSLIAERSKGRLQEWVEDLPKLLYEELRTKEFEIEFYGTELDFNDLEEVFKDEKNVSLKHKLAKKVNNKERKIEEIFKKIQDGPFEELKSKQIISAFENARNNEFEICVVATMSAGKSTLINSLLGQKMMPSKQEACTAIITRIKDNDADNQEWKAEAYDKNGDLIEKINNIKLEDMERLNDNEEVGEIHLSGDIPFVDTDVTALVLIDTPGPNNARNESHGETQKLFLKESSKSLVLFIIEPTFGTTDANLLLERIADSMKIGGKQSKDRFLFVVNKMDARRAEDGKAEDSLNRIREYLQRHGIENPNLFPVAALPALNIKLMSEEKLLSEDDIDETEMIIKKFNKEINEEKFHLEKYGTLSKALKSKFEEKINETESKEEIALIHTGVPSLELAIKEYVEKYAQTAKIKNIVDTFQKKLEESRTIDELKEQIISNIENAENFQRQIENIEEKMKDGNVAQKFKKSIEKSINGVNDKIDERLDNIQIDYQKKLQSHWGKYGQTIEADEAHRVVRDLESFAKELQTGLNVEIEGLIETTLVTTGNTLLEEYRNRLASMMEDLLGDMGDGIEIDPLKLMSGSINLGNTSTLLKNMTQTERVVVGQKTTKQRFLLKPLTWFKPKEIVEDVYGDVEYIYVSEMAQTFTAPIQEDLIKNLKEVKKYVRQQITNTKNYFEEQFELLDEQLERKLEDLKSCAVSKEKAEKMAEECEERLTWLSGIEEELSNVLEI